LHEFVTVFAQRRASCILSGGSALVGEARS
jgi:hypothetical protein